MAIELISGGALAGSAIDGGNVTINLPTLQEGDVVVVCGGFFQFGSADAGPSTSGYNLLWQSTKSVGQPQFAVHWKRMGSTPDTSITCLNNGNASSGAAYALQCLRGVDTVTAIDATTTTATGGGSQPDNAAITTATNGALVLACAGATINDASVTAPSGYTNQADGTANDTADFTAGIASKTRATAGAEDPGAWSGWGAGVVWRAATVALRPAPAGAIELTVQDATHAHSADNVTLTQHHTLVAQDASHAHTADNVVLTQHHVLTVQDASHAHAADRPALTQHHALSVDDATHGHTADEIALTQHHVLQVDDASHAHTADNVTLTAHEPDDGGLALFIAGAGGKMPEKKPTTKKRKKKRRKRRSKITRVSLRSVEEAAILPVLATYLSRRRRALLALLNDKDD